ncbi:TetR/AcrR family transcriptional regulator [Streptomycetaceae bacterium NBC_01309]
MPLDPGPTRRALLDAAIRLFALRGVDVVSQAEIVRAAGQRNTAALVYHFGGRDGLLEALVDEHLTRIRNRRLDLLARAVAATTTEVRPIVEASVLPFAEMVDGDWRDRAYLQIHADLTDDPAWSTADIEEQLRRSGASEVREELARRTPHLPADLRAERAMLLAALVVRVTSARARAIGRGRGAELALPHRLFVANLVDAAVAVMTAPVGPETAALTTGPTSGPADGPTSDDAATGPARTSPEPQEQ